MNANSILSEDMTLDEKLAAIDAAMAQTQEVKLDGKTYTVGADPADAFMCVGCQ